MPAQFAVTDKTLETIRTLRASGATLDLVAERIGCSRTTVSEIISRHGIPKSGKQPPAPKPAARRSALTPEAYALRTYGQSDEPLPAGHPISWSLIEPHTPYPAQKPLLGLRPIPREPGWTDPRKWEIGSIPR